MLNWVLTIICTMLAYGMISWFSIRAGQQDTFMQAFLSPVRSWVDFGWCCLGG